MHLYGTLKAWAETLAEERFDEGAICDEIAKLLVAFDATAESDDPATIRDVFRERAETIGAGWAREGIRLPDATIRRLRATVPVDGPLPVGTVQRIMDTRMFFADRWLRWTHHPRGMAVVPPPPDVGREVRELLDLREDSVVLDPDCGPGWFVLEIFLQWQPFERRPELLAATKYGSDLGWFRFALGPEIPDNIRMFVGDFLDENIPALFGYRDGVDRLFHDLVPSDPDRLVLQVRRCIGFLRPGGVGVLLGPAWVVPIVVDGFREQAGIEDAVSIGDDRLFLLKIRKAGTGV